MISTEDFLRACETGYRVYVEILERDVENRKAVEAAHERQRRDVDAQEDRRTVAFESLALEARRFNDLLERAIAALEKEGPKL